MHRRLGNGAHPDGATVAALRSLIAGELEKADVARLAGAYRAAGMSPAAASAAFMDAQATMVAAIMRANRWRIGVAEQEVRALGGMLSAALDRLLAPPAPVAAEAGKPAAVPTDLKGFATGLMDRTVDVATAINDASIANAEMVGQLRAVDAQAQAIAAATEETVAGVNEISARSQDVARLASEAHDVAEGGRQAVASAVRGMDAIAQAVADSASRVSELSEASDRIQDILGSIEAIAAQTNLLALNATIEAARAGEAGKGFAVVASEVKSLANQTAKATEDIRARLSHLRNEMGAIVGSMQEGTRAVAAGQDQMRDVSSRIDDVTQRVDTTTERMAEIAAILQQQTAAAQEVAHGVTDIAGRAASNSQAIMRNVEATKGVEALLGRQLSDLMKQDIPNKIVKIAKVDHIMWKKRLADMVVGLQTLRADELARHDACRLGKWYYGAASMPLRSHPAYAALEAPHRSVHEHGIRAVELFNAGDLDGAMAEIAEVEAASEQVVAQLDRLQNEAGDAAIAIAAGF
ncbi:methyl-accepting chemotaxis protein [Niveispirillum fermenti]|uniref:methyl-accepting chemotaxis protein n=1 Tax=Niveispirillum fermenti TaxID=1233113 RepID=UPI003A8705D6